MKMIARRPYSYDRKAASNAAATKTVGVTMTQQAPGDEQNITNIVNKFLKHGTAPGAKRMPEYEDFENIFDFQTAQQAIVNAKASFMSIPPQIRMKFDNDPQKFMAALADDTRKEEMQKLGLRKKDVQPTLQPFEKLQTTVDKIAKDLNKPEKDK